MVKPGLGGGSANQLFERGTRQVQVRYDFFFFGGVWANKKLHLHCMLMLISKPFFTQIKIFFFFSDKSKPKATRCKCNVAIIRGKEDSYGSNFTDKIIYNLIISISEFS